jgi:cytochrome bd-type quinol oxidase subunit 2
MKRGTGIKEGSVDSIEELIRCCNKASDKASKAAKKIVIASLCSTLAIAALVAMHFVERYRSYPEETIMAIVIAIVTAGIFLIWEKTNRTLQGKKN